MPRYPVYVISKGRHDQCLTAKHLVRDNVPFRLVVEPQEHDAYARAGFAEYLTDLPFANLGQGSIPARNWCWEDAKMRGAARHWILDDNIDGFWRRYKTRRYRCEASAPLACLEDFADRYENVGLAGFNYYMFAVDGDKIPPFYRNVHVYSTILIDNAMPYRWRGRYNEDTDLCLQVLSGGLCTVLLNVFLIWKMTTMTMTGGNTAELYKGDGRLKMARSLERAWPGVVETKRRFGRPQHVVKDAWKRFDTPLKRRDGVDFSAFKDPNEYGLSLTDRKDDK